MKFDNIIALKLLESIENDVGLQFEIAKLTNDHINAKCEFDGEKIDLKIKLNFDSEKLDSISFDVKFMKDEFKDLNFEQTKEKLKKIVHYEDDYYKCCICGKVAKGYGNNAMPAKNGICCDKCNEKVVIPARLKAMEARTDE